jgi:hypothetical protein
MRPPHVSIQESVFQMAWPPSSTGTRPVPPLLRILLGVPAGQQQDVHVLEAGRGQFAELRNRSSHMMNSILLDRSDFASTAERGL